MLGLLLTHIPIQSCSLKNQVVNYSCVSQFSFPTFCYYNTRVSFKYTSFHTATSLYGTSVILNKVVRIERSDHKKKIKQELEKVTFLLKIKAEENGQFED